MGLGLTGSHEVIVYGVRKEGRVWDTKDVPEPLVTGGSGKGWKKG